MRTYNSVYEVIHIYLPENNIAAKRRLTQTVGEAGDLEGVEDPFTGGGFLIILVLVTYLRLN